MPAHLKPLPRCYTCGSPATEELNNTWNSPQDVYCDRCAGPALGRFKAREERENAGA